MNQIMQGQPLTIFGDGLQTRAFTYIDDIAPVIANGIDVPDALNQVFNVGADTPYTVNEIAKAVMQAMGVQAEVMHLSPRNEVLHTYSDHSKVRRVFGDRTPTSLEDGLNRMAAWAKVVGARQSKRFEPIEILKNLPSSWLEEYTDERRTRNYVER
jgi:UDP-glucose 4-epimerase